MNHRHSRRRAFQPLFNAWFRLSLFLVFAAVSTAVVVAAEETTIRGEESSPNDAETTCRLDNISGDSIDFTEENAECGLVMAPSAFPNSGWGVFVLRNYPKGVPVGPPDLVIHIIDLQQQLMNKNDNKQNNNPILDLKLPLQDYWWSPQETGGFYEGRQVVAHLPGIGMLANTRTTTSSTGGTANSNSNNVLPFVPTVHEGGATRQQSPNAGAFTHYFNTSFYTQFPLTAGTELLVNYGRDRVQERQGKLQPNQQGQPSTTTTQEEPSHSVTWLQKHGRCLDHLTSISQKPQSQHNPIKPHDAMGRGAAAVRNLRKGAVVAPVPVLPISKASLQMNSATGSVSTSQQQQHQLLLNYCWGHANSSLLLLPYGPGVSLINHAPTKISTTSSKKNERTANVRLRWARHHSANAPDGRQLEIAQLLRSDKSSGLLLELVATRDIRAGEEILVDYGPEWQAAFDQHVAEFLASTSKRNQEHAHYAPSYVYQDAIQALRVQAELVQHPYPPNIFTSCFVKYPPINTAASTTTLAKSEDGVTTFPWKMERGMFALEHLRPCNVLSRQQPPKKASSNNQQSHLGTTFTVQLRNRYGLSASAVIPKGEHVIVTKVPRHAIRFSDKIYTTDQHLPGAFRHWMSVDGDSGDDNDYEQGKRTGSLYPPHWLDLA